MTNYKIAPLVAFGIVVMLAVSPVSAVEDDQTAIDAVLTDFHDAAAKADFDRYFGHFTDDGIFYGTDPALGSVLFLTGFRLFTQREREG